MLTNELMALITIISVAGTVLMIFRCESLQKKISKLENETRSAQVRMLTAENYHALRLNPIEFDRYLCWIFSTIIERVAFNNIVPEAPEAKDELVSISISSLIAHFAPVNNAIEEAYGDNYLTEWATLKMSELIIQDKINPIINHEMHTAQIFATITIPIIQVK